MNERVAGRFEGKTRGPLLICIAGMHGNEPSGINAIEEVTRLLRNETLTNPEFNYCGKFIGVKGNLKALAENKRFIGRDLNRMLTTEDLHRIRSTNSSLLTVEDTECIELIQLIENEIANNKPEITLILDLHTTTAGGGIFTIAADDPKSKQLAIDLHAPVILGLAEGLTGTTIEYFNQPAANCYCVVFEAGQHSDPDCLHRSVAAIINCMRSIGAVRPEDVDQKHDGLLRSDSIGLPKLTRLIYHYRIKPDENFQMKPGFKNFQYVYENEEIASNQFGPIYSPKHGLILMPKYQEQGEDGFFIVKPVDN